MTTQEMPTSMDNVLFNETQLEGFITREELKEKIQAAREEGMRLGEKLGAIKGAVSERKKIEDFFLKQALQYYTRISQFAYEVTNRVEKTNIKILSCRLNGNYTFADAQLLFIIECPTNEEYDFSQILNEFEENMTQLGINIESHFVNASSDNLNHRLIQADYPTPLDLALVRNAFNKLSRQAS